MKSPSIVPKPEPYVLKDCGDLYSFKGAGVLAKYIERVWKSRGYSTVVAERFLVPGTLQPVYGVRSNLVNGIPPKQIINVGGKEVAIR